MEVCTDFPHGAGSNGDRAWGRLSTLSPGGGVWDEGLRGDEFSAFRLAAMANNQFLLSGELFSLPTTSEPSPQDPKGRGSAPQPSEV